jgi:DNA-binding phage protein
LRVLIVEYLDATGRSPFAGWFDESTLDDMATTRWCCSLAAPRPGSSGISQRRMRDGPTTKSGVRTGNDEMALSREFKDTVKARAARDPDFREALLIEAAEQLLAGDLETGKAVLRDYINATVGFERLARETGTPSKSLMRMLGPKGNPRASNLLAVLSKLQRVSGVHLAVAAGR